jgi:two-component system LytT family response regulator
MIRAIVVDDEKNARGTLSALLRDFFPEIELVGEAESPVTALQLISATDPDLAFLDVEMQTGTGFELLESLPDHRMEVIFVTAHADYALQSFRFDAVDYLTKPIRIRELREAIEKAKEKINAGETEKLPGVGLRKSAGQQREYQLTLPELNGFAVVTIAEIIRCEGSKNYTIFYLRDKRTITAARTLKDFEGILEPYGFIRIHKSHLVNAYCLRRYFRGRGGEVEMEDGSLIPVSRERKDDLLKHFEG